MHSSNELQYIQNSESQMFLSSLIYMPLILTVKNRRTLNEKPFHIEFYRFDSCEIYLKI